MVWARQIAKDSKYTYDGGEILKALASLPNRRRAVGMKRLDRLQPPGLALLALFLGPDDRFPVRRQDEAGAGVGDLDAIAAGFVHIQKERLLDGVLVGTGFDVDAVFQKNVGGAQNLLAAVERVGDVMETARRIGVIA